MPALKLVKLGTAELLVGNPAEKYLATTNGSAGISQALFVQNPGTEDVFTSHGWVITAEAARLIAVQLLNAAANVLDGIHGEDEGVTYDSIDRAVAVLVEPRNFDSTPATIGAPSGEYDG